MLFIKGFVSAQIVHARGNQLVPEPLLKPSDTLHTQFRHSKHLQEKFDTIKILFEKMLAF